MKDNHFKYFHKRIVSSPIMINLELTSACNIKCRHCYNFWRDEDHFNLTYGIKCTRQCDMKLVVNINFV